MYIPKSKYSANHSAFRFLKILDYEISFQDFKIFFKCFIPCQISYQIEHLQFCYIF